MNVGTPQQGALPLDHVPAIVRAHGLSDAHPWPLVSAGKVPGRRFTSRRVPAADGWKWAELEYGRTPTSYAAVLVDLDGHDSADRLDGAVLARAVQPPSWTVRRRSSGGLHAAWALTRPVHRYEHARRAPLDLFARVSEWYGRELRGDPGYAGVLAHNPESGLFEVRYVHAGGWALEELADPIPAGWRRPSRRKLVSAAGRNATLFMALCRFAGRLSRSVYEVEAEAERVNGEFVAPLDANELRDVINHVHKYRVRWRARGHQPSFIERQRTRGRRGGWRSGAVRFEGSNEQRRPWEAEGVSRRTWYYARAEERRVLHSKPTPLEPVSGPAVPGRLGQHLRLRLRIVVRGRVRLPDGTLAEHRQEFISTLQAA